MISYDNDCPHCARAEKHADRLEDRLDKLNSELSDAHSEIGWLESEIAHRVGRWIPVSERLPEQADLYLVCNRMGALWIEEWISEPTSDWVGTANITAWRPLPKPYEEGK